MRKTSSSFWLSTGAVLWSVALVAVAYWFPAYSGTSSSGSCDATGTHCTTTTSSTSATLVEMNGGRVLVIMGLLIALAVVSWTGLHFRCAMGSRFGLVVGWAAAIVMLVFAMISFGLGVFVLPMAAMMLVAAATVPAPAIPAG